MLKEQLNTVMAFAPASCANLAVGFDALGLSFNALGDKVTLERRSDGKLVIESISGVKLPSDPDQNTATIALKHFLEFYNINQGFNVKIKKGIPVSSGLGGSAASAIAALVAINQFLVKPVSKLELARFGLESEKHVSGQAHADNIVPSLFGGLTLTASMQPLEVIELPLPHIYCMVLHPKIDIPTRLSRQVLPLRVPCRQAVRQAVHFASFTSSLYRNDLACLQRYSKDVLVEQYRADLIPGFYDIQHAAFEAGALMCSISGSGPSIFAWSEERPCVEAIADTALNILKQKKIAASFWIEALSSQGARILQENNHALL